MNNSLVVVVVLWKAQNAVRVLEGLVLTVAWAKMM
jgi:hypothetical protein